MSFYSVVVDVWDSCVCYLAKYLISGIPTRVVTVAVVADL